MFVWLGAERAHDEAHGREHVHHADVAHEVLVERTRQGDGWHRLVPPEWVAEHEETVRAIAHAAQARGIAPVPMSPLFMRSARPALLLGVSNVTEARLESACATLREVIARGS